MLLRILLFTLVLSHCDASFFFSCWDPTALRKRECICSRHALPATTMTTRPWPLGHDPSQQKRTWRITLRVLRMVLWSTVLSQCTMCVST